MPHLQVVPKEVDLAEPKAAEEASVETLEVREVNQTPFSLATLDSELTSQQSDSSSDHAEKFRQ